MYRLLFTASLVLLIAPLSALGVTSTQFVKVETGRFDDGDPFLNGGRPNPLADFNTYAMRVTADTDWTNADMSIELDDGNLSHITEYLLSLRWV